jgi:AraC-like DNA-binding protein
MPARAAASPDRHAPPPGEWARFAVDRRFEVEVLHARFTVHGYEPHAHDDYAFGLIEDGLQTFRYRRAVRWGTPGAVFALNPGELHDGRAAAPATGFVYRALHVGAGAMRRAMEDALGDGAGLPFFAAPVLHDAALAEALRRAHAAFAGDAPALERETALLGFLMLLARRHADAPEFARRPEARLDRRALEAVREHLAADLARDPSADELAALAGAGRFQLLRAFRRAYGMPPHAYQRHLRLLAARRLLAAGEPPADVAAAVGFADQSHLTKRFKGAYGVTPGRFRAACLGAPAR